MDKTKVAITGKISASKKTTLKESILLGKPHTILPAVMMVEGAYYPAVDNIDKPQALYFSSHDLEQSVNTWNGRPVSYNHPEGKDTCNSPDTFNEQWVGYVFNTRYEEDTGSLKAELWIDNERGKSITNRIRLGDQIDVSIGAFGDLIPPVLGTKETKSYDLKMTNIVGDHLAVLPDGKGACGWKDGCGVRASVFSLKKDREVVYKKQEVEDKEMSDCVEKEITAPEVVVEKERVTAKETIVDKKFNREEWLAQAPEEEKEYFVTAANNYESAKERHILSIIKCDEVKFCKEALGKIKDVSVLESIAALVNVSLTKEDEIKEEAGGVDYRLRSVAASSKAGSTNDTWAKFKDVDYTTI